jgi:hypothetical protein
MDTYVGGPAEAARASLERSAGKAAPKDLHRSTKTVLLVGAARADHLARPGEQVEKLLTIGHAARELGIPYFKLARAVKNGLVSSVSLYNSRRLVRISEILAVIEGSRR